MVVKEKHFKQLAEG